MTSKTYHAALGQLVQSVPGFDSFSIVNQDGQLLFSKETRTESLATTRLVAFQIIKKYLRPQPLDLFILNDPENGGYNLTKIIFVAPLHENLYVIWTKDLSAVDFKIPPTPLYEKNQKNSFVWAGLVDSHAQSTQFKTFFESERVKLDLLHFQKDLIQNLSVAKNQVQWLKATQEIFESQFSHKASGTAESTYRISPSQIIKLKLIIEERQNVKLITLDFSQTSLATDYSTASHVVESGIIQKIIQFYQVENFFSQSILDKIKIMLPPKSIVSKAHPQGLWNEEIQSISAQLCAFNLSQLNSQARKAAGAFEANPELKFELRQGDEIYPVRFDQKVVEADGLELLTTQNQISFEICQRSESQIHMRFRFEGSKSAQLFVRSKIFSQGKDYAFKINDESEFARKREIQKNDIIDLIWKIT